MLKVAEKDIAQEAARVLSRQTGLEIKYLFGEVEEKGLMSRQDGTFLFEGGISLPVEVRKNLRKFHVQDMKRRLGPLSNWILVTNYLSRPMQNYLLENRVFFVDLAGNAYLRLPEFYILVKGEGKATDILNPPSDQLSQAEVRALFGLLLNPDWLNHSYRKLEGPLQVGIATLSKLFRFLQEKDFITSDQGIYVWRKRKALEDAWIDHYGRHLKDNLLVGRFRFASPSARDKWKDWQMTPQTRWGGEPAGELITDQLIPGEWIIYTQESPYELIRRYRIVPNSEGPIAIYHQFWNLQIERSESSKNYVPQFLIVADLVLSGSGRNIQIAQQLRKGYENN